MKALLFLSLLRVASACVPVTGDQILGKDLVLADSALSVFPKNMVIAPAPAPGAKHIVSASDIIRIAKTRAIALEEIPADVCFTLAVHPVSADELLEAMRHSLPRGATVEIVEAPSSDIPAGEIRFPLNTLEPGTDIQTWRGFVQYAPTRRTPISARVRINSGLNQMVLTRDVAARTVLTADLFVPQPLKGFGLRPQVVTRVEQIAGTVAKTALRAGQGIPLAAVEQPVAVRRGDVVSVEVRSGSARLQLDAIAQRTAHEGEVMEFLNPLSGKTFKARLEGSRAVVTVGGRL